MIKIFLVEDEYYALTALKQKIIDLKGNYEVIGTAANGTEALKALETLMPDILMTDIRMPDMDGITLITKIKEQNLPVIPIIISGYQEFEYAKQAVRIGVQDYLLKPVNPVELKDCLNSCIQELTENISKKSIFSFLIGDESFRLESLSNSNSFTIIYIVFSNVLSNYENMIHPSASSVPYEQIIKICMEIFPPQRQIFCFNGIFSNEKVVIIENLPSHPFVTEKLMQEMSLLLSSSSNTYVTLYYMSGNGSALSHDIQTARNGAARNMLFGKSTVANQMPDDCAPTENLNDYVELFTIMLQQNELSLLNSNIHRMFRQWDKQTHFLMIIQSDLIFILDSLKRRFATKKPFDFDSKFFVENLICFSSNETDFANNFSILLSELFHFEAQPADLTATQLVTRIENYFEQNISKNISLQDLADELNVSKVYLCRIFKKYKNTTPIDYLTHMKIKRSADLIKQFPNMSLLEVSESLGFNDVYYFSKVFKKIKGVPPSETRKNSDSPVDS